MPVCAYCWREAETDNCEYCGRTFCLTHLSPPDHDCPNVNKWRRKGKPQVKSKVSKKSTTVSGGSSDSSWKKTVGITATIVILLIFGLAGMMGKIPGTRPEIVKTSSLPEDYYSTAESYVPEHYNVPEYQNVQGLADFLSQIEMKQYKTGVFDCSQSASYLEWLLEGAGFKTEIVTAKNVSGLIGHAWVFVEVEGGDEIAVEATASPPAIVLPSDQNYSVYPSISVQVYEDYNFNPYQDITSTYESPAKPMKKSTGYEWGWWNVEPYRSEGPFAKEALPWNLILIAGVALVLIVGLVIKFVA